MKYSDFVDYSKLDPFKQKITKFLAPTFKNINPLRISVVKQSLGEPAVLLDFLDNDFYLAFKSDGVGTKNKIADEMIKQHPAASPDKIEDPSGFTESSRQSRNRQSRDNQNPVDKIYRFNQKLYSGLGIDLIAMNVNDLVCLGARPIALSDEVASGDSGWFKNDDLVTGLLKGLKKGCNQAGVTIPCGETPTLKDIIFPDSVNITGSMVGMVKPKNQAIFGQNLKAGDRILGLKSNGIHSNGLTLARKITEKLKKGYFYQLGNKTIGEELLKPTKIYNKPILEMINSNVDIHYISNITGSAFKKIMRAKKPFTYEIENLPKKPKIFKFLQEKGKVTDKQAYQTWNMGVGMVIITPKKEIDKVGKILDKYKIKFNLLGKITKGRKRVFIKPLNIVYEA